MPRTKKEKPQFADPAHGETMKRLASILKFVPRAFHPDINEWLRSINNEDLPVFFATLAFAKPDLHAYQELISAPAPPIRKYRKHVNSLRVGHRTKPLILHIDFNTGAAVLISIMVSRDFHDQVLVVSTENSCAGLILASALVPDLIVTDIMQPGMDGFTFVKWLKKNPVTQDIPFMFLTARGDAEAVSMGVALGAKSYLSKPILHKDLIAVLKRVMGIDM